jgi:hypothetical protein
MHGVNSVKFVMANLSFNYLWMLIGRGYVVEKSWHVFEIVSWLSPRAVVPRLWSPEPKEGAARTLWIHMLRWILILLNSSIRIIMVQGERGSCHNCVFHWIGCATSKLHVQNPMKSNGSNRELTKIIQIMVCKPDKEQETSFQTIELTSVRLCFVVFLLF